MKFSSLKLLQATLLLNWPVGIAFALWILVKAGLLNAVLFLVAWVVLDKLWDVISGLLIAAASAIGANEYEEIAMEVAGVVPMRMAIGMIVDIAGTLVLPWAVGSYFLKWFA